MTTIGIQLQEPSVEYVTPQYYPDWAASSARFIETMGRTSYQSDTRGNPEDFIRKHILHESMLEHASFSVKFMCSRSCSHQLVRHRLAAYTQESQRFCDYASRRLGGREIKTLNVIIPSEFLPQMSLAPLFSSVITVDTDDPLQELFLQHDAGRESLREYFSTQLTENDLPNTVAENIAAWCTGRLNNYKEYLHYRERGFKPEVARSALPSATKTVVAATYNYRMWRHILGNKVSGRALNPHAQKEIKTLTLSVLHYFNEHIPWLVEDLLEKE